MPNLLGQSLGRYQILEQLGEGGMAVVYKAYDTHLEREVALKLIRTERLTLESAGKTLKRFELETKSLAKLTHPNIVPVVDFGKHENKPFFVMPYLPGGTLKKRLGKPIPWQEAVRLLLPIARALDYAHRQNIIHRDVKPSNILITQTGEPMLSDFGVAKVFGSGDTVDMTGTGMGVGTPEYMAPEQFHGKADLRADIYSLGIVLYEMVTGRKPYVADTPAALIIKQATEPLPRPRQYVHNLPDGVEQVLLKALAKNPADRYQNMGEFSKVLEVLSLGSIQSALHPITLQTLKLERTYGIPKDKKRTHIHKKWPVWAAIIGLLVILVAILAALIYGGWQPFMFPVDTPDWTSTPKPTQTSLPTPMPVVTKVSAMDGMMMVYVPEGEFLMGTSDSESRSSIDEKPQHAVYLDSYWIDQTEVTNNMYKKCVAYGHCRSVPNNAQYSDTQFRYFPVRSLSIQDAQTYCEWVGRRLPTEAEWEKAARGTDGRLYPWGDSSPDCRLTNFGGKGGCVGDIAPVGSYPAGASPYGALDMAGNIWEWVADWYSETYYVDSPRINPQGPTSGLFYILRGGSWYDNDSTLRSTYRLIFSAYFSSNNFVNIGFRCALPDK